MHFIFHNPGSFLMVVCNDSFDYNYSKALDRFNFFSLLGMNIWLPELLML